MKSKFSIYLSFLILLASCATSPKATESKEPVAVPPPPLGVVTEAPEPFFAEERIPCKLVMGLCYVEMSLNKSWPFSVVLDTGSSLSVLDKLRRPELKLHETGEGYAASPGTGASSKYFLFDEVDIHVGKVTIPNQDIISLPFAYVGSRVGYPTDGTLGSNLFVKRVVEIDYLKKQVTVSDPKTWKPEGHGEAIPIMLEGNVPFIEACMTLPHGEQVSGRFIVDTGQILSGLLISESFASAHPQLLDGKFIHPAPVTVVGGSMEYSLSRVNQFKIGSFTLKNIVTSFPKGAAGVYAKSDVAGGIGPEILRRFKVVFDYPHKRMFLKPNTAFSERFETDLSGLQIEIVSSDFHVFTVTGVMKNSPAARAGIKTGDVITEVDGKNAGDIELADVLHTLQHSNKHCQLTLQRKEAFFKADLELKPLF